MVTANYQTLRLSQGKHKSPEQGACVMELASMLAEEPFSDRPRSVSPVIGAFLRAYNDAIDDDRRQDLYAFAAKAVGTRSKRAIERRRVTMCVDFAREACGPLILRFPLWAKASVSRGGSEVAGTYAAHAVSGRAGHKAMHADALAFLDRLIAVGQEEEGSSEEAGTDPSVGLSAGREAERVHAFERL